MKYRYFNVLQYEILNGIKINLVFGIKDRFTFYFLKSDNEYHDLAETAIKKVIERCTPFRLNGTLVVIPITRRAGDRQILDVHHVSIRSVDML